MSRLDDGEAAAIACAVEEGAVAFIDDGKAVSLCSRRYPNLAVASTLDLFAQDAVLTALGRDALADALHGALQFARTRVLPQHEDWVVGMIGHDRARSCESLRATVRFGLLSISPDSGAR